MSNQTCVEILCDDKDWKQNLPITMWLEKPFFKRLYFHKENLSGSAVIAKMSIHSEYLWTVINMESLEDEMNKLFKGSTLTNELTNPVFVEDFIKDGTLHVGISDYFYRWMLEYGKDVRYEAIESYFQLLCEDVFSTIKQAYDIQDEFEVKEYEKIKLTYLQQKKGKN